MHAWQGKLTHLDLIKATPKMNGFAKESLVDERKVNCCWEYHGKESLMHLLLTYEFHLKMKSH